MEDVAIQPKPRPNRRKTKQPRQTPRERFEHDVARGRSSSHHRDRRHFQATKRCCSARWVDDVWNGIIHDGPHAVSWREPVEYPPGLDRSAMRPCARCNQFFPPQYCVDLIAYYLCADCASGGRVSTGHPALIGKGASSRRRLYELLKKAGLTDQEIAALAWRHHGLSLRGTGEFMGLGKSRISQILQSAKAKLAKAQINIGDPAHDRPRRITLDPAEMDQFAAAR